MKDQSTNLERPALTRREAIQRAVTCGLAAAALPISPVNAVDIAPVGQSAFKPDDDYPFFGYEPKPIE